MAYVPSFLSFLGIAKEATPGTAVAATNFLRPTDMLPHVTVTYLPDEGVRGAMAKTYNEVAGVGRCEYEYTANLYADEVGWPVASMLNDLTVTGASDPYTTTFALLNSGQGQPTTYTISDYNGNNTRQYTSCVFSELTFKLSSEGLVTYTAKATGSGYATASKPTLSLPATTAMPGWQVAATLAGSAALIVDAEVQIKRTVTPVFTLSNTQVPNTIFAAGDMEVTGTITAVYDSAAGETIYNYYTSGTPVALAFDLNQNVNREVKLNMTSVQLDDVQPNRQPGKYADLTIKYTALANSTDIGASGGYSPIKVTTKSPSATGTYK